MDMHNDTVPLRTLLIAGADHDGLADDLAARLAEANIEFDRAADPGDAGRRMASGGYDAVLVTAAADAADLLGEIARALPQHAPGPKLILISPEAPAAAIEAAADVGACDVLIGDEVTHQSVIRTLRYAGEIHRMEERLADLALFDRLTGLPSHVLYWQFLTNAVERARRHQQHLAVMSLYVEGLSELNNRAGWSAGNRALAKIASRLRDTLRASDTVARFSGPKFSLLLESVREDADAHLIAYRLVDVVSAPLEIDGASVPLNATVGVALFPISGDDPQALLQSSIEAMDRAKDEGPGSIHFA